MKCKKLGSLIIVLCGLIVCWTHSSQAAGIEKDNLLKIWHKSFQELHSLRFNCRTRYQAHPAPAMVGMEWTQKFVLDGSRFRNETYFSKSKNTYITAYNGERYQSLNADSSGAELTLRSTLQNNIPYGGTIPLLDMFDFAFRKTDTYSVETLQNPETWANLSSRIISVRKGAHKGRPGRIVKIRGREMSESYQVFVEDATHFPLYFQKIAKKFSAKRKRTYLERSEFNITSSKRWQSAGSTFLFPLRIEGKLYTDNKVSIASVSEIDAGSIKINRPVPREIFTIPKSQATLVVDIDRQQEKIQRSKGD